MTESVVFYVRSDRFDFSAICGNIFLSAGIHSRPTHSRTGDSLVRLERWLSGRRHRFRKPACSKGHQEFESLPLRTNLRLCYVTAPDRGRFRVLKYSEMKKVLLLSVVTILLVLWVVDVRFECPPSYSFILKGDAHTINCAQKPLAPGEQPPKYSLPWFAPIFNFL
jgi:hypothetical protein